MCSSDLDFPNPGVAPVWFDIEGVTGRWIRVTATKLATRSNDYIFALSELMVLDANGKNLALGVPVTALDSIEAPVRWRKTNLVDGIYPANDGKDAASQIAKLEQERNALIRREFGEDASKRWSDLLEQQQVLKSRLSELPAEQFVYAAATHFKPAGNFQPTLGKPRKIHLLARGSETQPLDEVGPSPLQCIQDLPKAFELGDSHDESSARLALAEWIVDPKNPLTWRSIVNRIWHFHFGRGIVDSLNDFGQMGGTPTHPELLDWLADEFRRNPSIKDLHRKIVTSSVYLQRSDHHAANSAIDASNQYLWRMNRRRLEAEAIRDSVLQVSGKLDPKMGGPGFQLFGLIDDHSPHYLYEKYNPDDPASHRRSIYRFIVRSVPDPWMTTLDCEIGRAHV